MELMRIGSAFGSTMASSWQNARLRSVEKRIARELARWHRATRGHHGHMSWKQRLDACVDPLIACAAGVMLCWLVNKWL
jgi:hypothetical protein